MNYEIILPAGSTSTELQTALDGLQENDSATITICSDMPFIETVSSINQHINITIKSDSNNNWRLYYTPSLNEYLFDINSSSFTFSNITLDGVDSVIGIHTFNSNIELNKSANIVNCSGEFMGGGISLQSNSKLTMNDGAVIENCNALVGGGIYALDSEIEMNDGAVIQQCTAKYMGGGLSASNVRINMFGVSIRNNSASSGIGGGAYLEGDPVSPQNITLHNASITGNKAVNGGGIFAVRVLMKGGIISENEAQLTGGGVVGQLFIMEGGVISKNRAKEGGGIYASENVDITGGSIEDNVAEEGGGMSIFSFVTISDCKIINNRAENGNGGGILNNGWLTFVRNSLIFGNSSSGNGGGIASMVNLENSSLSSIEIVGNSAFGNGGGIYLEKDSCSIEISQSSLIAKNTAEESGGGIYWTGEPFSFTLLTTSSDTVFSCNRAISAYAPPPNASELYPSIQFISTSLESHVLNNFDINYEGEEPINVSLELIYDANGGTGSYEVLDILPGGEVTILSPSDTGISRIGYNFVSWNTEPDGSGDRYAPRNTLTVNCDTTLYAIWSEPISYSIIYEPNGGVGYRSEQHQYGEYFVVLSSDGAGISRNGYIFVGWNTQPDGSGVTHFAGEIIMVEGELNLYAQWRRISGGKGICNKSTTRCRISIEGQKVWIDDDNAQNRRPQSVRILLLRNGTEYRHIDLDSLGDGRFGFCCVPVYNNDGNEYVYTIDEIEPDNYAKTIQGNTIINTLIP